MALTSAQLARLGELLDQSLPMTLDERRAWLETLPAPDQALRQTLSDALLADDPAPLAGQLLDRPPRAAEHRVGERLGAYELLDPLGAGGMAEVWLARRADGAFDRKVALKIPRLGHVPAEMSVRFGRECRILASLEVPGVARLYDAGVSEGGVPYIAMEYVAGEPLTTWCDSRGLDAAGRIAVFLQVLEAVGRAHAQQVIHRDLKPSNILVTRQGEIRLLDFGIAQLLQGEPEGTSLTQAWGRALTPEYASPEMLRGVAVDARSDIYSLGVVLQELLGRLPAVPASVRGVVNKALAPSPDDRYPDAATFAAALRAGAMAADSEGASRKPMRIALAAGVAIVLVIAGFLLLRQPSTPTVAATAATPVREVSLAVLPFADLSSARDQEYLGEGVAEEIINQLAQNPAFRLVGLRSTLTFKGRNEDLRVIGEKLGVDNLLDGTIRKEGQRLRVSAQLLRARDGTPVWSNIYERELRDVFAVQEEIARDVAQVLSIKLDVGPMNRARGGTTNLDAYNRYLRWRQLYLAELHSREAHRQRAQLLREAVQFDPQFALAWGELGEELGLVAMDEEIAGQRGGAQVEALRQEARRARARAVELAPQSWIALRIRSEDLAQQKRWAEAIEVARQILDTGPFTLESAYPITNVIFSVGHLNETVDIVERVIRTEPLVMYPSRDQQWNLTAARRYAEAAAEYRRSANFEGAHVMPEYVATLRMIALEPANRAAIREQYARYLQEVRKSGRSSPFQQDLSAVIDDRAALRAHLRKVVDEKLPQYQLAFSFADAAGDGETALKSLSAFLAENGDDYAAYWELWTTPYSNIRTLPGFKTLLRDAGIVEYWRATGQWGNFCRPLGEDDFECH